MRAAGLLIFEDPLTELGPLMDVRPQFDVRTGVWSNRQRLERLLGKSATALYVREELKELCVSENPGLGINCTTGKGLWLAVNGAWLARRAGRVLERLQNLRKGLALVDASGRLIAALVEAEEIRGLVEAGWHGGLKAFEVESIEQAVVLARPWQILDELEKTIQEDLEGLKIEGSGWAASAAVVGPRERVQVAADAQVLPGVVFDVEHGPVVVEAKARIGAGSVLEGPCYVGPGTQLAAHTYLRSGTVLGPVCKVAGEISFSIIQGYSNKAHLGFLGHSLVGQWVNLGAGTTVSNLKNTYGPVRVRLRPEGPVEETGRMFLGAIIGDFVRTAIGTRIPTGASLATGSMIALSGFAPKCSRPFGFYTDEHPEGQAADVEKFLVTARVMMKRRDVEMSAALERRLRAMMGG